MLVTVGWKLPRSIFPVNRVEARAQDKISFHTESTQMQPELSQPDEPWLTTLISYVSLLLRKDQAELPVMSLQMLVVVTRIVRSDEELATESIVCSITASASESVAY